MESLFKEAFCSELQHSELQHSLSLNKCNFLQLQEMVCSEVYILGYCGCGNANWCRVGCNSLKVGKDEHKKQESLPQLPICSCMRNDNHQASNFLRKKCVRSVDKKTEQMEFV